MCIFIKEYSYHENVTFLFIDVLTLYNTVVQEHQFCGKIAHSGHCFVTKVTIFEKHNRHYVKTQQKSSK